MVKSLQGHFLIATPDLLDPNFAKTVVLMVQHNEQGALGLILNRPTQSTLHDIWKQISTDLCLRDNPIYLGGPVHGPLIAIHEQEELSEIEIVPGVHFCVQTEGLRTLADDPESRALFFVGHSGWAAGQLEMELEQGSWLTPAATADEIFSESEGLWDEIIGRLTGGTILSSLKVRHVPRDPTMN